jgi:uncharacterized protein with HXXEE motif
MDDGYRFRSWFVDDYGWARMSLPSALIALCSLPLFLAAGNAQLSLLYTLLPAYMVHQYEEHARGEFAAFVNSEVGQGREVLTRTGAFWINVLGVWVLFLALFYLAKYAAVGFALAPVYATLINGATHAMGGVALRRYNPGLYTSLALFLPWGVFLLVYFNGVVRYGLLFNVVGVLVGVALHAIIIGYLMGRRGKLLASGRSQLPEGA